MLQAGPGSDDEPSDSEGQGQENVPLTGSSQMAPFRRENSFGRRSLPRRLFRIEVIALVFSTVAVVLAAVYLVPMTARAQPDSDQAHREACSKYSKDCQLTAPFIFNSVASLLKQWPNTYASNGHTIASAIVPPNTQMYHARYDGGPRKTPTFYAFDAEMSLGIYGNSGDPRLYTMVSTRPLNVLYFDGESATLTAWGTLDSQMALLQGKIPTSPSEQLVYDEDERARQLCVLAKELKIDGFVRMNAGFEVLVCDSTASGVIEVFQADVTVPGNKDREADPSLPQDPNRRPPLGFGNEFAPQSSWEWIRSGTWHYVGGSDGKSEGRVQIDYCGVVTYYDPTLQSLSGRHHGTNDVYQNGWGLRRGHRLLDISKDDIAKVKNWLKAVTSAHVARKRRCSGTNWQALTETILNQHQTRGREIAASMRAGLRDQAQMDASVTKVHELSHAILYPYIEYPFRRHITPAIAKENAISRCASLYVRSINDATLNDFEVIIKDSIAIVMKELCNLEWTLFEWTDQLTSNLFNPQSSPHGDAVIQRDKVEKFKELQEKTQSVIDWLGWDEWHDCQQKCNTQELCYIPMWPVIYAPGKHQGGYYADDSYTMEEMADFWTPRCLNRTQFDYGGGRGREPSHQIPDPPWDDRKDL